jgi:hypothetical protein
MKNNDLKLLEEAYISAVKKLNEIPVTDITSPQPDTPKEVELTTEPSVEPEEETCSCQDDWNESPEEHESEEIRMAKTNLFSLYKKSKLIHNLFQQGVMPHAWTLQKIAICASNLEDVAKSIEYHAAESGLED